MQEEIRLGVAGVGFMGCAHSQELAHIPRARLAAVKDRGGRRRGRGLPESGGGLGIEGSRMGFSALKTYSRFENLRVGQ